MGLGVDRQAFDKAVIINTKPLLVLIYISFRESFVVVCYVNRNKIMILYRKRAIVLHLITFGMAFAIGCLITLSMVNVKNCENAMDLSRSTIDPNRSASSIFLVIIILSAPKNMDQRNTIRRTWLNLKPKIDESQKPDFISNDLAFDQNGFLFQDSIYHQSSSLTDFKAKLTNARYKPLQKDLDVEILHYFAIGTENLPFIEANALNKEHAKHHDLLLLNDLHDSYANLTRKLVKTLRAVSNIE